MGPWQSLSHVRWDCKCPISIIPKHRKKALYGRVRRDLGPILRDLCEQKEVDVLEGHGMPDHVHRCLRIPPQHSVAYFMGFLKGKSAVRVHRGVLGYRKLTGLHCRAAGCCVSAVGLNEEAIRKYIQEQEKHPSDQGALFTVDD